MTFAPSLQNCIYLSCCLQLCFSCCFADVWLHEVNQLKWIRSADWNTNRGPREIRLINSSRQPHLYSKLRKKEGRVHRWQLRTAGTLTWRERTKGGRASWCSEWTARQSHSSKGRWSHTGILSHVLQILNIHFIPNVTLLCLVVKSDYKAKIKLHFHRSLCVVPRPRAASRQDSDTSWRGSVDWGPVQTGHLPYTPCLSPKSLLHLRGTTQWP